MCSINNNIRPARYSICMCNKYNSYNTVIKSCCIIYILFFLSLNAKSQNPCDRSISGVVVNKETNDPLSDVVIRAITDPQVFGNRVLYNSSDKFSISDENGKFLLKDLCPEEDSLVFSELDTRTH